MLWRGCKCCSLRFLGVLLRFGVLVDIYMNEVAVLGADGGSLGFHGQLSCSVTLLLNLLGESPEIHYVRVRR